ncbi:MAG: hypothetical protein LBI55_01185 [Oscillospiraceae bacterium]|jgi:hypothetical protein|nr:hypothetical protein [Oscillospiraceae bacterium]
MDKKHQGNSGSKKLQALDEESLGEVFGGFENATLQAQKKLGKYPEFKRDDTKFNDRKDK